MRLLIVLLRVNVLSISALMALTISSRRCSKLDVKPSVKNALQHNVGCYKAALVLPKLFYHSEEFVDELW